MVYTICIPNGIVTTRSWIYEGGKSRLQIFEPFLTVESIAWRHWSDEKNPLVRFSFVAPLFYAPARLSEKGLPAVH